MKIDEGTSSTLQKTILLIFPVVDSNQSGKQSNQFKLQSDSHYLGTKIVCVRVCDGTNNISAYQQSAQKGWKQNPTANRKVRELNFTDECIKSHYKIFLVKDT